MKTRTILLLICLFVVIRLFAQTIPEDQARIAASTSIAIYSPEEERTPTVNAVNLFLAADNTPLFYVYRLLPRGYVIISALYDLPPVIAYSFSGITDPEGRFLDFVRWDLTLRMKNIPEIPVKMLEKRHNQWNLLLTGSDHKRVFQQWPERGKTPAEGWIETNWTQDEPYNSFCPMDPVTSSRSLAGCPAVAMAQIINFHSTTSNAHFSDEDDYYHNYAGRKYWIDNDYLEEDFPSFLQLNDYLLTLKTHYQQELPLTDADMAALVFACGVAAKQVFASNGSGTFGVDQAYDAYLKFNVSTVELLDDTDTNLYTRMAQNVIDTLPVHLAVVNPGWTMGHNVVVDGYNTDKYFHLNFGWGGPYNGWYLLPDEIPYGLTVIEGAVVDIIPQEVTGIREPGDQAFRLFPNPVREQLTINSVNPITKVEVYSVSGQLLAVKFSDDTRVCLDLSKLDRGIYLVKIVTPEGEAWKRAVKE